MLDIDAGSQVVVDAGGLVMKTGVDANGNLTFTHGADVYTLGGLGSQLTAEKSQLSLYNNQTGSADDVQIGDVLSGISTAAGGSGAGGADGFIDKNGDGVPDSKGSGDGASLLPNDVDTLDLTHLLDTSQDVVIAGAENSDAGVVAPGEATFASSQTVEPGNLSINADGSIIL